MPADLEFDPFSAEMMEEPYPTYKALREHAPVYFNETRRFWAVTKYDDTRTVLKDYSTFSNREGIELDNAAVEFFGESDILELDPPEHKEIRGIFNPHFTPAKMRELEPRVRKLAEDLIEPIAERGEADISRDFCWTLPIQTICIMLGVSDGDRDWVAGRVLKAFKREPGDDAIPEEGMQAASDVRKYFGDGVEGRRREPLEDLLTAVSLSKNLKGEPMSPDEVGGLCLLLFAAGIITTGSFLSNSLYILRDEEEIRRRLIAEAEILPKAVEELWRYESPVANTCRTAIVDVTLRDQEIKAGEKVVVFPPSANRDEDYWENGEELDIDRDFKRNMVFGDGAHVCVGAHLARLEGRIGLRTLLTRIPDYELTGPIERTDRMSEHGIVSMPVRF